MNILNIVASHFGITPEQIKLPFRYKRISRARSIAVALCREVFGLTQGQIQILFRREHSRSFASQSYTRHKDLMVADEEYRTDFLNLKKQVMDLYSPKELVIRAQIDRRIREKIKLHDEFTKTKLRIDSEIDTLKAELNVLQAKQQHGIAEISI